MIDQDGWDVKVSIAKPKVELIINLPKPMVMNDIMKYREFEYEPESGKSKPQIKTQYGTIVFYSKNCIRVTMIDYDTDKGEKVVSFLKQVVLNKKQTTFTEYLKQEWKKFVREDIGYKPRRRV